MLNVLYGGRSKMDFRVLISDNSFESGTSLADMMMKSIIIDLVLESIEFQILTLKFH